MTRRSVGHRLYARLLHLYPREFREEYGAEMTRVYRDRAEGERLWRLWPALLIDICHTAPREQLTVLTQDIRHAWRSFARTPLVTAAASLTIALGVGGSTAVFSMVYAIVLRPLPYPTPHRLVEVFEDHRESNLRMMRASALNYRSWGERNASFDALAAFQGGSATITEPGHPERLAASFITASMFDVLALPLIEGRGFRAEDAVPGAAPVVVLAEGFWRSRVPALRASRLALLPSLAQHGKGTGRSASPLVRHGIVAAQMTLATMLLVGAALLLQSLMRLQQVPLGFTADRVVTARISLPRDAYPDADRADAFWRQLLESLRDMPQVQAAGLGLSVPFSPGVRVSGRVADLSQDRQVPDSGVSAVQHIVSPGYFQTLGMPLVAGREFGPEDRTGAPAVAVVSEDVARRLWANDNPIGKRLDWKGEQQAEVIGVVGDVRGAGPRGIRGGTLDEDPASAVYFSSAQQPQHTMTVLVRTSGQVAEVGSSISRVVRDIDSRQPVCQVRPLSEWVDEALAQPRFTSSLIAGFAVMALLLAAVGVYGMLSYSVAQRTQEIGVRMAVGAERGQILLLVLRGSMGWALGGIAAGLIGALVLSRLIGPLLLPWPSAIL